ncbi:hypothetical protein LINGRAHAP2_LOCUS6052 [Linum grandiflorum]
MELIVVISVPLIVFFLVVGAACFFYGRSKRRNRNLPDHQVFGVPAPPPSTHHVPLRDPSSPPAKHDNSSNV